MNKNEGKNMLDDNDDPATLPGPAIYEEELKDYTKESEDDPVDNLPDSHPEPSPTATTNE